MIDKINKYINKWDLALSDLQARQFRQFLQLIKKENTKINLTSIVEDDDIVLKHFIDSLTLLNVLGKELFLEGCKVIDIGTGAGFPGIPLKILFPKISITLVEATNKKVLFINKVLEALGLEEGSVCLNGRAELLAQEDSRREKYDLAIARAVAPLSTLSEYLIPFLKLGGRAVFYKGGDVADELRIAAAALLALGGEVEKSTMVNVEKYLRTLIVVKKQKETPLKYPRRPGIPQKRPIL
jgi:16S rRNA (guanine527-N7)-methyltransferase